MGMAVRTTQESNFRRTAGRGPGADDTRYMRWAFAERASASLNQRLSAAAQESLVRLDGVAKRRAECETCVERGA